MKFFSPTGVLKELLLLEYIEANEDCTQKELAKVIDAAVSMVNVYINDLEEKGYLKRDYQSAKIVYYRITAEGIKRKNYLLINYMRELLDLYRLAKENVEGFLQDLENKGYIKVLIYGAGDVAETILGIVRDRKNSKLKVVAIIDDNEDIQGQELLDYKIISRKDIKDYEHDAVIITSYAYEDEIIAKLEDINYPKDKIIKFISK